jgi:hypothetical protein
MAALLITDDYFDAVALLEKRGRELDEVSSARDEAAARAGACETTAASTLEDATRRIGDIAARLAEA